MAIISFRIPNDLAKLLEKMAEKEERSKAFIIKKALQTYLEDLTDYHIAEKKYKEYVANGKRGMTIEELAEKLEIDLKDL